MQNRLVSKLISTTNFSYIRQCIRLHSDCVEDATENAPRCRKEDPDPNCANLKRVYEVMKPVHNFSSIWQNPECCGPARCADAQVRYDDTYWHPGVKDKEYQQTWVECPPLQQVAITCFTKPLNVAEPEKREHPPKKPLRAKCNDLGLRPCTMPLLCEKIKLPGCRAPNCSDTFCRSRFVRHVVAGPRFPTPYPCYSECNSPKYQPKPRAQCDCLILPERCERYAQIERESNIRSKYEIKSDDLPKKLTKDTSCTIPPSK